MTYGDYPDLDQVKKILVIKLRHHGDVLLTSPLFSNLKRAMPQAEIDAFIYRDTLPMLEGHPAISDFMFYDRAWKKLSWFRKLAKEAALLKAIRSNNYDLVINLTEGDRGAIAAVVSSSRIRVGFDPQGKGMLGKRSLYTHVVKICPHPRHTVERQLDVLRRIGIFPSSEERDLFLHISDEAKVKIRDLLDKEETQPGQFLLIHPVSRWRFKCLSVGQVAAILRALHQRGVRIVMTAGPDAQEVSMVDEILSLAPDVPVVNCAGKLTLKELAALIDFSRVTLCVDSVPLHIASALKKPVVVVFGPTSEQNWGPWRNSQARIVSQQLPCRPCYQDGCGGSKMSDCLFSLEPRAILAALDEVWSASQPEVFTKVGSARFLTL